MGIWNYFKKVIGTFFDHVAVPYLTTDKNTMMGYLRTGYYHVHGASFLYPDKANPVTLTSSASAWSVPGNIIEVIPANTITKNFDLHWVSISDISSNLYGVVDIYKGSVGNEIKIGSVDLTKTDNFSAEGNKPVQIAQQVANTRISCRFSDSTTSARTCLVKFYGHVYSDSLT